MGMARGIDHVVVAVRDLEEAARFYGRLGFQVGARNRHPWGTENRIVQFPGSFIELITGGSDAAIMPRGHRSFNFGVFVRDYLAHREGLAMLALDSENAEADAAVFAQAGIGDFEPFSFERHSRRPDGSEARVAFTLAFARSAEAPGVGFFVCQQHCPETFWSVAFQRHPNGAQGIDAVVLAADEPEAHCGFLEAFSGARAVSPGPPDLSFPLARGRLDVVTPDDAAELYGSVLAERHRPGFVAFAVRVPDVTRATLLLDSAEIPYERIGSRAVVPASAAFGVAIAFEPA